MPRPATLRRRVSELFEGMRRPNPTLIGRKGRKRTHEDACAARGSAPKSRFRQPRSMRRSSRSDSQPGAEAG